MSCCLFSRIGVKQKPLETEEQSLLWADLISFFHFLFIYTNPHRSLCFTLEALYVSGEVQEIAPVGCSIKRNIRLLDQRHGRKSHCGQPANHDIRKKKPL